MKIFTYPRKKIHNLSETHTHTARITSTQAACNTHTYCAPYGHVTRALRTHTTSTTDTNYEHYKHILRALQTYITRTTDTWYAHYKHILRALHTLHILRSHTLCTLHAHTAYTRRTHCGHYTHTACTTHTTNITLTRYITNSMHYNTNRSLVIFTNNFPIWNVTNPILSTFSLAMQDWGRKLLQMINFRRTLCNSLFL